MENNVHAKRKRAVNELLKGKEIANKLKTLLNKPVEEHGHVSVEELAMQIFRSFTVILSDLADVNEGVWPTGESTKKKKLVGVKDRRGSYKRRKSSDSWITVSPTTEDGCAWRKYGQKKIMDSKHPRCYYRCTNKSEGCKATKQVQIIEENPISYQTTYFSHHTCTNTLRSNTPQLILDSDPVERNLISFESNLVINNVSPVVPKKESKEDDYQTPSSDQDVSDDAKSSLSNPYWQEDIIGFESFGSYRPEWDSIMMMNSYQEEEGSSGFQSRESTSLHGLDMEVNRLGDLDHNIHYFDDL